MKQRIAAGAIVVHNDKILLVNHKKQHAYDFWVAPGGGVIGTETLEEAAIREVREETGLAVSVGKLMYIEEFWQPNQREVKFWFCCQYQSGSIDVSAEEAQSEHIVNARFMSKSEISAITVYPLTLAERVWDDARNDQFAPLYLGLAEMKVY